MQEDVIECTKKARNKEVEVLLSQITSYETLQHENEQICSNKIIALKIQEVEMVENKKVNLPIDKQYQDMQLVLD